MILTYRYRVKDGAASTKRALQQQASAVNFVWNYCCEIQREAQRRWIAGAKARWPSAFDLTSLTRCAAELGLHSDTVAAVCHRFAQSRNSLRRCPRWRTAKKSLGWIPINAARAYRLGGDTFVFRKRRYRLWLSRCIPEDAKLKTAAFNRDARGRWYVTIQFEISENRPTGPGQIGIDLGIKSFAATSDGKLIANLKHYRRYEAALARAARANNRRRVAAIHAKIANARLHHLHEQSTMIARENALIVVGNVSGAALAKTRMAKSVLDAGWSMFRSMLRYKAGRHGARYVEADERWTSATCSDCGAVSGPKGIAGLRVRLWECPDCGAAHDRDVNAARNILRAGVECRPLAGEIPA